MQFDKGRSDIQRRLHLGYVRVDKKATPESRPCASFQSFWSAFWRWPARPVRSPVVSSLAFFRHQGDHVRHNFKRNVDNFCDIGHFQVELGLDRLPCNRRTSRSRMWRRSSRRCTTMPSAPANSHSEAASTGSGSTPPEAPGGWWLHGQHWMARKGMANTCCLDLLKQFFFIIPHAHGFVFRVARRS